MNPPKIIAYLKPSCGWSQGVRAIMRKYTLDYEDRDIINNPSLHAEMVEKSGQSLSPCVEVNGHMLADVSGDEVEAYLLKAGVVQATAVVADAPTNRAGASPTSRPSPSCRSNPCSSWRKTASRPRRLAILPLPDLRALNSFS
jgi:monothiol glutaredoxin